MRRTPLSVIALSLLLGACPGSRPAPATTPAPASSSGDTTTETEKAVQADIDARDQARAEAEAEAEAGGPKLDTACYEGCILSQPEPSSDEADAVCTTDCTY